MAGAVAHNLDNEERTSDVLLKQLLPFRNMTVLSEETRKGLASAGFLYPTAIQASAIRTGVAGIDLLVQAKSGTGKTLIFSAIVVDAFNRHIFEPQALVLAPTRELAVQIEDTMNRIGRCRVGFRAVSVIGGMDIAEDRKQLQGANIIVATPGRLLHLIKNDVFNTSKIKLLVLDEADQMYSASFRQDLQRIQRALPDKRQTIACSATFPNDLDKELAKIMRQPLLLSCNERATLLVGVKQFIVELPDQKNSFVEIRAKLESVRKVFSQLPFKQCLIFASSQSRADSFCTYLIKDGWPSEYISGAQSQKTRLQQFDKFRSCKTRILVATDVMARGVDSQYTNLIINLDLPNDVITYLHRIGRAGRFGSLGIAISFTANAQQRTTFQRLVKEVGAGMCVYKMPTKSEGINFWDFANYDFPLFEVEPPAPLAEDEQKTLTDSLENKENLTYNVDTPPANSSIETKPFCIDSKDSAVNILDFENLLLKTANTEQVFMPAPNNSQNSSTQNLLTSNTIDDASSIAADSLQSSHNESSEDMLILQQTPIKRMMNYILKDADIEIKTDFNSKFKDVLNEYQSNVDCAEDGKLEQNILFEKHLTELNESLAVVKMTNEIKKSPTIDINIESDQKISENSPHKDGVTNIQRNERNACVDEQNNIPTCETPDSPDEEKTVPNYEDSDSIEDVKDVQTSEATKDSVNDDSDDSDADQYFNEFGGEPSLEFTLEVMKYMTDEATKPTIIDYEREFNEYYAFIKNNKDSDDDLDTADSDSTLTSTGYNRNLNIYANYIENDVGKDDENDGDVDDTDEEDDDVEDEDIVADDITNTYYNDTENCYTTDTESVAASVDQKHFPSPAQTAHNNDINASLVPPVDEDNLANQLKYMLTVNGIQRFEIPPRPPGEVDADDNGDTATDEADAVSAHSSMASLGDPSTNSTIVSSGFDEHTTSSPSSGIETSDSDVDAGAGAVDGGVDEHEHDIGTDSDTTTENVVESDDEDDDDEEDDEDIDNAGDHSLSVSQQSYNCAFARWLDMYRNQHAIVQDYVKLHQQMRNAQL